MENRIKEILRKALEIEESVEIDSSKSLKKYGFDSVALVRAIVDIEETYDIEICDDDLAAENFSTVNCICELVERYVREK